MHVPSTLYNIVSTKIENLIRLSYIMTSVFKIIANVIMISSKSMCDATSNVLIRLLYVTYSTYDIITAIILKTVIRLSCYYEFPYLSHKVISYFHPSLAYFIGFHRTLNLILDWSNVITPTWWGLDMEMFSTLLALCEGNPPVTGRFPSQRANNMRFEVYFDVSHNKLLNKQFSCRQWNNQHIHMMTWWHRYTFSIRSGDNA